MLHRVISGGQTGGDQAGWRAAKAAGLATGGWMPLGFLTEDGPRPEFAELYGAKGMATADYLPRTRRNAQEADATLWFGDSSSSGGRLTLRSSRGPKLIVSRPDAHPAEIARWIEENGVRILNVAGNRESTRPGIGAWIEDYLGEVFRIMLRG